MAKPENPGNSGNSGNEGADDPNSTVVVVTTDEESLRYEATSRMAVTTDGSLLVGKEPVAVFSNGAWLRAYVETAVAPPP